jgi:hypothetical protein
MPTEPEKTGEMRNSTEEVSLLDMLKEMGDKDKKPDFR